MAFLPGPEATRRGRPAAEQALEIAEGNLDLAAAVQSERQQLAMAQELRVQLDSYLSLTPLAKISARDVYRHVLAAKGAVLEHSAGFVSSVACTRQAQAPRPPDSSTSTHKP